ncbi:MAG: biosynthetic-type acetolactate synthase large subunit [Clostridiales bacterium]|nr:biosynthetic-type acetolactate synthase large subunit [Clostridiales bacterium]
MLLTGSQILVECLKEQGVDTIFGYPGGGVLNIYDELYRHQDEIKHILTSHEQGASHAADGYARATGKVGVCIATSGPGATNLVTGIATAMMDSVPMVAITGNVTNALLGKDSFQEVDIAGITMPITKHNFIVKDINKLADTIRRAFQIAQSGRPGPVLVDITKDVTAAKGEYTKVEIEKPVIDDSTFSKNDIAEAIDMIEQAKKPMIFVGGGAVISGASDELNRFADLVDSPVTDSLMGKGAYSGLNSRYTGMLGMHGTKTSNMAVTACDLLIAIGTRFSDRVTGNTRTYAKNAKILHIDIDPAEINKNIMVDKKIIGDVKSVLTALNNQLEQQSHPEWMKKVMDHKQENPLTYPKDRLTGPYILEKINELYGDNSIIATEVGQHQMWASQFIKYRTPRTIITSGGLGTMGYGLGAAIGAKIACPEKNVFNIAGDGCFRMNMNEIATATRYNIPVIEVIFNNHVLGMVRQWQTLFYGKRYSQTVLNDKVDFVKLAEAMGAKAYRLTKIEDVEPVLKEAVACGQPVVIDCIIDQDDKVWPMVPPGASIEDCFVGEE